MEFPHSSLPNEVLVPILSRLSATDLCHIALCSRFWREAANQDALWRPLCRARGWERYGTSIDLCEEVPFVPTSSENLKETGTTPSVAFPMETVVTGSDWPELVDTCKWKEVYMKARHLEENWANNRCHVSTLDFGSPRSYEYWPDYVEDSDEAVRLCNLCGDGDILVGGVSDGTMHVWDLSNGSRLHRIHVNVADTKTCLKVKGGIIAVGCEDGSLHTYSTQTGDLLQVMSGHRLAVSQVFFDGETIVSAGMELHTGYPVGHQPEDSDVRVWEATNGSCRFVLRSASADIYLISLDFRGETVACAYSDRTIRLWGVEDSTCKQTIATGDTDLVSCRLGNGFVLSSSEENLLKMWNTRSGELFISFDFPRVNFSACLDDHNWSVTYIEDFLNAVTTIGSSSLFKVDDRLGDTNPGARLIYTMFFPCIRGNRLVTAGRRGEANYLWKFNRQDGFNLVTRLRPAMFNRDMVRQVEECTTVWMSDTKLAFVLYFELDKADRNTPQVPKIVNHHYW